jgi:hypothetical protein
MKFFKEEASVGIEPSKKKNFLTCKQVCERYPWPPKGGLRHLIFNADRNGFDKVIRRVGKRVLIDEDEFIRYIEGKGQ